MEICNVKRWNWVKKKLYSKYPFLTYRLRNDGGFWVCDDEIDLITPRGSVVIVWSPQWQLIGSQFSIVTPFKSVGDDRSPSVPPWKPCDPENLPPPPIIRGRRGGRMNKEWSFRKPLPGPGPWHTKGIWLVIGKQYAWLKLTEYFSVV